MASNQRTAVLNRETAETRIQVSVTIDGTGQSHIDTGIPFFDHMLTLVARHGYLDLEITASGDTQVDYHHTVEDVGIVLGRALKEALGDKKGIARYGHFLLPMDESLARVVLDLGGRAHFVWQVQTPALYVRDFSLLLIKEFFRSLAHNLEANLHMKLEYGEEPHHVAEALCKGFARALAEAVRPEPRTGGRLPSTKEVLD